MYFTIFVILLIISTNVAFITNKLHIQGKRTSLYSLSHDIISQLDEMKAKYDRLVNLDLPEANQEREMMEDIIQKYSSYKEVKVMQIKLKNMILNEVSEKRKERQLKGFIDLYRGRLALEELIKEKLGLPYNRNPVEVPILNELFKFDDEIKNLEEKLKSVEIVLPEGKSTREARNN